MASGKTDVYRTLKRGSGHISTGYINLARSVSRNSESLRIRMPRKGCNSHRWPSPLISTSPEIDKIIHLVRITYFLNLGRVRRVSSSSIVGFESRSVPWAKIYRTTWRGLPFELRTELIRIFVSMTAQGLFGIVIAQQLLEFLFCNTVRRFYVAQRYATGSANVYHIRAQRGHLL